MKTSASTGATLQKVYKAQDGTPHLVFLASGPKPDRTKPIQERMTEKSLQNMVDAGKAGEIRLTPSHYVPLTLGKSVDASRDPEGNVLLDFAMKADSPLAMEVFGEFEAGDWADRQISVGGAANHVPVFDATLKARVTELDDMSINHACLTFPGKAMYPDAGIMSAVVKAIDENDTEALKAQGFAEEEITSALAAKAKKGAPMLDVAKAQTAFIEKAKALGVTLEPLPVEKGAGFQPDCWPYPSSKKVQDCLNALYVLSLLQDLCRSESYEATQSPEDKAQAAALMACCAGVEAFIASEIKESLEPASPEVAMSEAAPAEPAVAAKPAAVPEVTPAPAPVEAVTKAELSEVVKALDELKGSLTDSRKEVQALKDENASLKADVAKALDAPVEPGTPVFKDANGQPTTVNPDSPAAAGAAPSQLSFEEVKKAYAESKDMAEFQHRVTRLSATAGVTSALRGKR